MSAREDALVLPANVADALLEQARAAYPRECLGLVFGHGQQAARLRPLRNISDTPERRFLAEPEELLRALMEADAREDELVALYHSHPRGPATPSEVDLLEARYRAPMLIIVPETSSLRAFDLADGASERRVIVTVAPLEGP